ncbi:MAG: WYL domain-containing protein [Pseudomonadota bacterium]
MQRESTGYLIDKRYYLPPVAFDHDELEALALGIAVVGQWTDAPFAAKATSALEKISAALPPELQGDMAQITTFSVPGASRIPWTVSFSDIRNAIRDRRKIQVNYVDLQDRTSRRILRPLALIFASPVWVVAAWCESRHDFRNFRLDRIERLACLEDRFEEEPDKNLSAFKAREQEP